MKEIDKGYTYELETSDPKTNQVLQFLKKGKEWIDGSFVFVTVKDGVTNEEVLSVVLDRLQHLNSLARCKENEQALIHIEEAIMWLNRRTQKRVQQGVLDTIQDHV